MTEQCENYPHLILLGDSIFDNAAYVPDGLPVIEHLRQIMPANCQGTLLAIDGDVTTGVAGQTPTCHPAQLTRLSAWAGTMRSSNWE